MSRKLFLVDLEAVDTRYTGQWKKYLPLTLSQHGIDVTVIDGPTDIPSTTTPGAFLNFGGTNVYKAAQCEKFSRLFCDNLVKDNDYFLFTDAWHPGIINLKYMASLLGTNIRIGALWHAGSYDPADFLGRLIGDTPWVRHTERALFNAIDDNFYATDFHIKMFSDVFNENSEKMIRTGWPMEYMSSVLDDYKSLPKRDLILFPHRIAPEKQVEIFKDLAKLLPDYEFIACQEHALTKHEYHTLLGQAKMVFSASLQETLGIGCFEGAMVNAVPLVPDRLSYTEMYNKRFKYPSEWTTSFESYLDHKFELVDKINDIMLNYDTYATDLNTLSHNLQQNYFSCDKMISKILKG